MSAHIRILRSRVFSANMSGKFLIAPLLVLLHHVRERVTDGWPRRPEHPCTFRAAATLKTRPFNPYQLAARGHFKMLGNADVAPLPLEGVPFRMSATPLDTGGAIHRGPPLLGEDTDDVLEEILGMGSDEIGSLRAEGVLR